MDRLVDSLRDISKKAFEESDAGKLVAAKWAAMRQEVVDAMYAAAKVGAYAYSFDVPLRGEGAQSKAEGFSEAMKADKDFKGFAITYWGNMINQNGFTVNVRWDK